MPIRYTIGDATRPFADGAKIICHTCNDIGAWGAGFVVALSRRWPEPEKVYREWHGGRRPDDMPFALGSAQFVSVQTDITVANMIGQHGIAQRGHMGAPPVRYEAIRQALRHVADYATAQSASVHMPRIGAGLAGGDWTTIERIIEDELCARSIPATVYDFPRR
jgi:O-acetyl-ADP-ribose deacetylase (regulator of RNase III)